MLETRRLAHQAWAFSNCAVLPWAEITRREPASLSLPSSSSSGPAHIGAATHWLSTNSWRSSSSSWLSWLENRPESINLLRLQRLDGLALVVVNVCAHE
jgi:hypothetical protein